MHIPPIILGSQSPRRKEILSYFSIPFKQIPSGFDEDAIPFNGNPEEYACFLSKGKAEMLSQQYSNEIILTADTVVFREGKSYGKARDIDEAFQMISELSGKWHTVYTAVTVRRCKEEYFKAEATGVLFNELNAEQIRHYLSRVEWADKAGAYAIQMVGGLIVRKIDGCYYNVMGLPINTVETLLKNVDIELWDYL